MVHVQSSQKKKLTRNFNSHIDRELVFHIISDMYKLFSLALTYSVYDLYKSALKS